MTSRVYWLLLQLSRKLWFRASLFSALAVATALAAIVLAPYIPADVSVKVGAEAVDNVLAILASSMLAVTIFSIATLTAAYAAATTSVTPRAARLLIDDTTPQNALATFIGSFLFSLVGIIALSTGLYGVEGRLVMLVVTLCVILFIVITLLRWIDLVSRLGRVGNTTYRVEEAAAKAMRTRRERPYLDGTPLHEPMREIPDDAVPLYPCRVGYVQHIDMGALAKLCDKHLSQIYVAALPGSFIDPAQALAWLHGMDDDVADKARVAFSIGDVRSFDDDPRFCASVLTEIASRALSPAVNDPGTAIDVIGRAVRLLAIWLEPTAHDDDEVRYPRVHVPGIELAALFDDLFGPIARDGASMVEVGTRLQKALSALARLGDVHYADNARRHSKLALERALAALTIEHDKQVLRTLSTQVGAASHRIVGR